MPFIGSCTGSSSDTSLIEDLRDCVCFSSFISLLFPIYIV